MSFFAKNDNFSSSEDESEEEQQQVQGDKNKKQNQQKKFYGDDSDQSEDNEQRVVKKTADKRAEALQEVFQKMANHIKIQDFTQLQTDFDEVQAELEKCVGSIFATDKFQTLPGWVLKNLVAFEDCVTDVSADEKKKMNKLNATAYNKVKQKLKKYLSEGGDSENSFAAQVQKYRDNMPDEEEKDEEEQDSDEESSSESESSESSSSSDSESSEEKEKKPTVKEEKKEVKKTEVKEKKKSDQSSSEENSDEESSSESSSSEESSSEESQSKDDESSSDGEEVVKSGQLPKKYAFLAVPREKQTPAQRRWKWVRYDALPNDMKPFIRPPSKKIKEKDEGAELKKKEKKELEAKNAEERIKEYAIEILDDKDLDFSKSANVEKILNKYKNTQNNRRNFEPDQQIEVLLIMHKMQKDNNVLMIEILIMLIQTYFASAKFMVDGFLKREIWVNTNQKLSELVSILSTIELRLKDIKEQETTGDLDSFQKFNDHQILPAIMGFVEKLDQQLLKAFQNLNAYSMDYLYRLRDECLLLKQCDQVMQYLGKYNESEKIARIGLIKLEHLYYKNDFIYKQTLEQLKDKPAELEQLYFLNSDSAEVIQNLVNQVQNHCPQRLAIKAIILQVYHHSIHNRYFEAKELLFKSKITYSISKQQISNQVHYNRAVVQIGLAAFRLGMFEESNQVLIEVCQVPKLKESLAQTLPTLKLQDKTLEEELEEKKRFIPPHLHINMEVLDCVYMTTSMFQEIPNISQNRFTIQTNVINRNFRKLIEQYDLKGIQFLPQNSRDNIVFAARALHRAKWQDAFVHLSNVKIFKKMEEFRTGNLQEQLKQKLKESALIIYINESQKSYHSLSLSKLETYFELPKQVSIKMVSKEIIKGNIEGKMDMNLQALIFEKKALVMDNHPFQEKLQKRDIGWIPETDRREVEFLQNQHLGLIKQIVDANQRCMELLIPTKAYIQNTK